MAKALSHVPTWSKQPGSRPPASVTASPRAASSLLQVCGPPALAIAFLHPMAPAAAAFAIGRYR
ncbi:hypothetical protein U9M48_008147 [Paspalum notatum var. saurae]|uniref:Uncharacterized protein n=1 Tax=Paspalum notatum var. saurae TaxID=547442 RepID=A0AAQ3WD25_PASNO